MVSRNILFYTARKLMLIAIPLFLIAFIYDAVAHGHAIIISDAGQHEEDSRLRKQDDDADDDQTNKVNRIEIQPRFIHIITEETTLGRLAQQLDMSYTRLLTYNMEGEVIDLDDQDDASPALSEKAYLKGDKVVVPFPFPLHDDMKPLKVDVLENKFVAVYRISLPYSRVNEIMDWYRTNLIEYGYVLHEKDDEKPAAVRLFSGGMIALGTVEFSPGDEQHPTLIDIALVVDRDALTEIDQSDVE